jgi:hypothetical protein
MKKKTISCIRGERIPATLSHDAGAYGQCVCGMYSDNPAILSHNIECECVRKTGWSGSFKKPGINSEWSVKAMLSAAS